MPEFKLDTDNREELPDFAKLPEFIQGYIEAAFFTDSNEMYGMAEWDSEEAQDDIAEGRCSGNFPKDAAYGDIAESSLHEVLADCEIFQTYAADLLEIAYTRDGYDERQAGMDFWYTRNGHGTGFWDRGELKAEGLGDRLAKRARKQGNVDSFWQDGKVYLS